MNQPAQSSPDPTNIVALLLNLLPGCGSLLSGLVGDNSFAEFLFFVSPPLALTAGILLGFRSGQTTGSKLLFSALWTIGSLACSLLLQAGGCAITNYKFDVR